MIMLASVLGWMWREWVFHVQNSPGMDFSVICMTIGQRTKHILVQWWHRVSLVGYFGRLTFSSAQHPARLKCRLVQVLGHEWYTYCSQRTEGEVYCLMRQLRCHCVWVEFHLFPERCINGIRTQDSPSHFINCRTDVSPWTLALSHDSGESWLRPPRSEVLIEFLIASGRYTDSSFFEPTAIPGSFSKNTRERSSGNSLHHAGSRRGWVFFSRLSIADANWKHPAVFSRYFWRVRVPRVSRSKKVSLLFSFSVPFHNELSRAKCKEDRYIRARG